MGQSILLKNKYERQRISRRDEWRDKEWMNNPVFKSYAISKELQVTYKGMNMGKPVVPMCSGCDKGIKDGEIYIIDPEGQWYSHRNYYCWIKASVK